MEAIFKCNAGQEKGNSFTFFKPFEKLDNSPESSASQAFQNGIQGVTSAKWFCHTLLFLLRKQILQTLRLKLVNSKGAHLLTYLIDLISKFMQRKIQSGSFSFLDQFHKFLLLQSLPVKMSGGIGRNSSSKNPFFPFSFTKCLKMSIKSLILQSFK